jgi:conjugative transfer region protein (TIGR03750 family)
MGELSRIGIVIGLISIITCELFMIAIFGSFASIIFGFLIALIVTVLSVFLGGKIMASRKSGKPYGYSDQVFATKLAKLGLKKIACVTSTSLWTHKKINRR